MSVAENFQSFDANYRMDLEEVSKITKRYLRITAQLNDDFRSLNSETANSLYVGSYGRKTASSGLSDVDMVYVLPGDLYQTYSAYLGNGQSALLQRVKRSISETYSTTEIGADGQVVQVSFRDGVQFEILPAFNHADKSSFIYPDSNGGGSWKVTNPRAEIAAMRTRNDDTNKNLRRLCRMMRVWRDYNDVPLKGLLIDTLAYQFIGTWAHRDKSYLYHDWMARDFFAFVHGQDRKQDFWKAPGSGQYVWKTGPFQTKAGAAYNLALEAINHDENHRPNASRASWRKIFGPKFPNS